MMRGVITAAFANRVDFDGICLSGGCALSCPTNTLIATEPGAGHVFIPPSCDDTGLASGAALWMHHNLLGTDGTARVQTVTAETGNFHALLTSFAAKTGCPVVMNTSLNGPGEPIVETPDDAVRFLLNSGVDVLYLDGHRVTKSA
jgi:predicted NodU family carbamoyl transferase